MSLGRPSPKYLIILFLELRSIIKHRKLKQQPPANISRRTPAGRAPHHRCYCQHRHQRHNLIWWCLFTYLFKYLFIYLLIYLYLLISYCLYCFYNCSTLFRHVFDQIWKIYVSKPEFNFIEMTHTNFFSCIRITAY